MGKTNQIKTKNTNFQKKSIKMEDKLNQVSCCPNPRPEGKCCDCCGDDCSCPKRCCCCKCTSPCKDCHCCKCGDNCKCSWSCWCCEDNKGGCCSGLTKQMANLKLSGGKCCSCCDNCSCKNCGNPCTCKYPGVTRCCDSTNNSCCC